MRREGVDLFAVTMSNFNGLNGGILTRRTEIVVPGELKRKKTFLIWQCALALTRWKRLGTVKAKLRPRFAPSRSDLLRTMAGSRCGLDEHVAQDGHRKAGDEK